MSTSKHTPGPWTWQDEEECLVGPECIVLKRDEGGMSFALYPDGQHEANARLIAAAPQLLAALKALDERGHTEAVWMLAKRAIAKAESE